MKEKRRVVFDTQLNIEAYHFEDIKQKFPNHFHEFYVLGYIEVGQRLLSCKNQEYQMSAGDLLLLNPYDNHCCEQIADSTLNYKSLHIEKTTMMDLARLILGKLEQPAFCDPVIFQYQNIGHLHKLHQVISDGEESLEKEELFYLFMAEILTDFSALTVKDTFVDNSRILKAVQYIDENFAEPVSLDKLSQLTALNKYSLIRQFTKNKGVTPHQYLTATRISEAKKKIERQNSLTEIAFSTGFADQSHFTRAFKTLIGVTPKQYQNIFVEEEVR